MAEAILLEETLESLRLRVNSQLDGYLRQLDSDCPEVLRDSMAYSLLAGGKRLRPLLTLLACEAAGGHMESAMPAACAIEMIHTYSLIHDDLPAMDDDDLRRGRPTCHIKFGEAQAILAGDALLTLAFEIVARDVTPAATAAACCVDLANAAGAVGMVGGQVADLQAEDAGISSVDELEAIHRRKTGRLLCAALTMGGRIGGAGAEALEHLSDTEPKLVWRFKLSTTCWISSGNKPKWAKASRKTPPMAS